MEPNPQDIERQLSQERENLGNNVSELENRAKAAISWREHFNKSPGLMLGLAFGGGVLLASLQGGSQASSGPSGGNLNNGQSNQARQSNVGLDAIASALIAAAAASAVKYLGDRVPGFRHELDAHVATS